MDSVQRSTRWRARFDRATIIAFGVLACAPLADEFVRDAERRGPEAYEQRRAAPLPRWTWPVAEIERFPAAYEAWHRDQFGLRDLLLAVNARVRLGVFDVSPTQRVEIGKDGWMFYTGDLSRQVFSGDAPFDELRLEQWASLLANHRALADAAGARHLFVIAPNKETIYPDYVPRNWHKRGPTRLEQLDARCAAPGSATFFDLRPALAAARANDAPFDHVYYELGTHWNGRGTFRTYRTILNEVARLGVPVRPFTWNETRRELNEGSGDSWARQMYAEDFVEQRDLCVAPPVIGNVVRSTRPDGVREALCIGVDPAAPRAVMFHDSFGDSLVVLLSSHFSRLRCVWAPLSDASVIAEEQPDLVLEVFVERALVSYAPVEVPFDAAEFVPKLWERSRRTLYALDPAHPETLTPRGEIALAADGAAGVRVDVAAAAGSLALPRFDLPAHGDLLVHIALDGGAAGTLRIVPLRHGETEPRRRDATRLAIPAGPSEHLVRIPRPEQLDRLLLHFGPGGTRHVLRALEVRALPGP